LSTFKLASSIEYRVKGTRNQISYPVLQFTS